MLGSVKSFLMCDNHMFAPSLLWLICEETMPITLQFDAFAFMSDLHNELEQQQQSSVDRQTVFPVFADHHERLTVSIVSHVCEHGNRTKFSKSLNKQILAMKHLWFVPMAEHLDERCGYLHNVKVQAPNQFSRSTPVFPF